MPVWCQQMEAVMCVVVLALPHLTPQLLARLFPKGTVPFGSATKETMCSLAPPQNQHIFNSHLNCLNLRTVQALNIELSEH